MSRNVPPGGPVCATSTPWWRVPMMWLVLGGPLAVVVASIVTTVIAVRNVDPVIRVAPAAGETAAPNGTTAPAIQARNHAATPAR